QASPAAVLLPSTPHNKEAAARLAIKTGSGLITDAAAVEVDGDIVTATQSVFAGSYTTRSQVTKGLPIITVKPNILPPTASQAGAAVVNVDVQVSDAAKGAKITDRQPKQKSGRPELTEAAIVVSGGRGTGGDF
ncbi:hypothetical protein P5765_27135, partial [Bacillus cereus]|nr:hypothetical protein [Bacillus cereus]